jgi:hypothetical protein
MNELTESTENSKTSGSSIFARFSSSHIVVVYLLIVVFFGNLT